MLPGKKENVLDNMIVEHFPIFFVDYSCDQPQ